MHARTARTLTAATVLTLAAAGSGSAPAAATDEFPANPDATTQIDCYQGGAAVRVTYTNAGGLQPATFQPSVDGVSHPPVTVGMDETVVRQYDVVENDTPLVVLTATGGYQAEHQLEQVDCIAYVGSLVLDCGVDGEPRLLGEATRTKGFGAWDVELEHDGGTEVQQSVYTFATFAVPLDEDAPFSATLRTWEDELATLSGVADCAAPPPPSTTTTTTAGETPRSDPDPGEAASPSSVLARTTAPTTLPRTGASVGAAGAGAALVAAGAAALAAARRLRLGGARR